MSTFENWLALGRHGSMGYLATETALQRRRDPRQALPECRSILVLSIRYPDPASIPVDVSPASGRVAAYAWGQDYHLVLADRLQALTAEIETLVGHSFPYRYFTDTGPLLERELAQRAGLGWIGKNTCLIDPRQGSYILLAEILLGVDLEPDPPFTADRCGKCTRCIQACPTACILPDRTIDARRCISYLTIENKGPIPPDLRPLMGKWVFGCDICQIVCPWNRFSSREVEPAFAPRPGVPTPDLKASLGLTPQEFNRQFKESPIQRSRRKGWLRNVAVALGNSGDQAAVPLLQHIPETEDPLVREHAVWAIEKMKQSQH